VTTSLAAASLAIDVAARAAPDHPPSSNSMETARHRTAWLESGPSDGPLLIFLHGWPALGLVWRMQMAHFASAGWRCVAPDLRGVGGSSVPNRVADYALREVVADMVELHDALGGKPALWVGHSLGSTVAWAMAMHYPRRCRGVVGLTVPHFARGGEVSTLVPLVNRAVYPADKYPVGQWDYMLFYAEHFTRAVRDFEANTEQIITMSYSRASPGDAGKPTPLASIRAQGGWFPKSNAPSLPPRPELLPAEDKRTMVAAFARSGFSGACAWYLNGARNLAFAAEAPDFGRLSLPALFLHAEWDAVCDTSQGRLAEPMREDCSDLTEARIAAGHVLMLEEPGEVNRAIADWIVSRRLAFIN
jgi:pimeloyl-ACP methyl ester carboxylesterase